MTERIKDRISALSSVRDAQELKYLLDCALADLTRIKIEQAAVLADLTAIRAKLNCSMLSSADLAIGGGSKYTAQAVKPFMALANGVLVFKPAATGMSVLAGTIAQTKFALWAWYIDSAGTITTSTKTADADSAALAFALMPTVPANKTQIGAIIVTNSGEAWDAETDALDKASTTVIYIDNVASAAIHAALTAITPVALTLAA